MTTTSNLIVDEARIADAVEIHRMVAYWAERTPVLAKSLGEIYENLREFVVARQNGQVVGAAALHIDWADLAEIRTVVVDPSSQGRGIGKALIDKQIDVSKRLGLERVFVLTDRIEWFTKLGFGPIDKSELPHKVWRDCVHCPLFTCCTEVALVRAV